MKLRLLALTMMAVLLFGCESTPEQEEVVVEDQGTPVGDTGQTTDGDGAQAYGADETASSDISSLDDPQNQLYIKVIYFDYDSSEIRSDYRSIVDAHAAYLAANPGTVVTLEGHADERGSREYNLALGERRAHSVRQYMTLLGVSSSQINTVSYGEERPALEGHDESAWSQNRRVEIIY